MHHKNGNRHLFRLGRFEILSYAVIVFVLVLTAVSFPIYADDIQLMLPDMNVSSRPIVEFRARKAHGHIDISVRPPHIGFDASPGHAYVLLGRELDNGLTVYNTVAGFYPKKSGGIDLVRQLVVTPGAVKQTLDDAKSEITFKIYITPIQEQKIAAKLGEYNTKDYSLGFQNCVSMTRDIAQIVGLKIPKVTDDLRNIFPQIFMDRLRSLNKSPDGAAGSAPTVATPLVPPTLNQPGRSHAVDAVTQGKAGAPVIPKVPILPNPANDPVVGLPNLPLPPNSSPAMPPSLPPPPPVSLPMNPPP